MAASWDQFEYSTIGGLYVLGRCLRRMPATAYFYAESQEARPRPATVRLVRGDRESVEAQVALWNRIGTEHHPNLLGILATGQLEDEGGVAVAWAAIEHPEECVGDVLQERALTAEEARQALIAVTDALAHIHGHGLVHGEISPAVVVAAGDTVKLTSDNVREPGVTCAADDIWSLGLTACEMLIRRQPVTGDHGPRFAPEDAAAIAPFERFLRGCFEADPRARWTAARLAADLRGEDVEAAPSAPAQPAAEARAAAAPPPEPRPPARQYPAPRRSSARKWGYLAAAACIATAGVLIGTGASRKDPSPAPPPREMPSPVVNAAPEPRPSVMGEPRQTAPATPQPRAEAARTASIPEPARPRVWRVIAYTYVGRSAAEHRARDINNKFPELRAEVFAPWHEDSDTYLVSLGGPMTREEAVRLQRAARSKGLPRDTYVRNFKK